MSTKKTFSDDWVFASIIQKNLNASRHETEDTKETFSSGRPKKITRFYCVNNVEMRGTARLSMELISKRTGQPYVMCSVSPLSAQAHQALMA